MQFPESWLRELVNPACSSDELAHELTMAGLEVEEHDPVAPPFTGVVVSRITSVEPHPDADRLRVCRVDAGDVHGHDIQIVCGAPNAAEGLVVPLATVGAELPGGMKIGPVKMRGVESFGMLCSARELGLSQDHAGLLEMDTTLVPGTDVREALNLNDWLLTISLTPNRADCLSMVGVAREVAAIYEMEQPKVDVAPVPVTIDDKVTFDIQAPDLCGRFTGRVIRGVNARAQTPAWMVERLERSGQRSVSALVDISNYVMLERGRPSHVFDLDKLTTPHLEVRWSRNGESIKLLNEETIELNPKLGVITCDGRPESLAGIMGGDHTAVTLDTTNIFVEAAFWWPEMIAGRTRELKLTSEAAHRFERGVDFANIVDDLEYMTALILEICGGDAGPVEDVTVNVPERQPVQMRLDRCKRVLGIDLSEEQIGNVFDRLDLTWSLDDGVFTVTPPSYRFDLEIEEDLIEEVARLVGFDSIPAKPPLARTAMRHIPETERTGHDLRDALAARDYQEVINFSFVEPKWETRWLETDNPIGLVNPITSHMSVMRTSLMPGLLANIAYNANRRQNRVRVFEVGRIFKRDSDVKDGDLTVAGIDQPLRVAAAAWGPADDEQWGLPVRMVDFFDVKRDVELLYGVRASDLTFEAAEHPLFHPGRSARILLEGKPQGWMGELHPKWVRELDLARAPIVFELAFDGLAQARMPQPGTLSRQPVVQRDMALWVDASIPVASLLATLQETAAADENLAIVKKIRLFDVWEDAEREDQQVSVAFRVWMQDPEVTLEDERVDACMKALRLALETRHSAKTR